MRSSLQLALGSIFFFISAILFAFASELTETVAVSTMVIGIMLMVASITLELRQPRLSR